MNLAKPIYTELRRWLVSPSCETGQTLMEYALIISYVAIVLVGIVAIFSGNVQDLYNTVAAAFP